MDEFKSNAIEVANIVCLYGAFQAVSGLSFRVRAGELFSLLGTNGAGKTTTIETLEGFIRPTRGTVSVLGVDPYGRPPRLRAQTNAVLQHSGTFPELKVGETLNLARGLCARPRDRDEVLKKVGLSHRTDVQVRALSGGEKRRLDLALALVTRPRVLFLDEPTTGMDAEGRQLVWQVLSDVRKEGTTILLTTHYLEEAERLSDRLAIMHAGRTRVEGTVEEVLSQWGDHIEFILPEGVEPAALPQVKGTSWEVTRHRGDTRVVYTVRGGGDEGEIAAPRREWAHVVCGQLMNWAEERDARLLNLRVRSASLEDVFLEIANEGQSGGR
ncbi:ABC transporter ATP-binding protein [Nonomuraea bangladeshensis]|uniref:ABC transporter ATP-binding protein n=1 Tax=Nonomuraea bangladeshensis TaxID=404385 RepID=UPI003F4E21C6